MVIGLGALATGSGAVFSSAAFSNSTASSADLRVVVEETLNFEPNEDAVNGDTILGPDQFDDIADVDDFFDDQDTLDSSLETPIAATNGAANENLRLVAAVDFGQTATFSELFTLKNDTSEPVDVGIAYDRNDTDSGFLDNSATGQYGGDIAVNDEGGLSPALSRASYQFVMSDPGPLEFTDGGGSVTGLISPAKNGSFIGDDPEVDQGSADSVVGSGSSGIDARDRPASAVRLDPGEETTVDLVVDTTYDSDVRDALQTQADFGGNGFGTRRATIDLLDGLTVGTLDDPTSSN